MAVWRLYVNTLHFYARFSYDEVHKFRVFRKLSIVSEHSIAGKENVMPDGGPNVNKISLDQDCVENSNDQLEMLSAIVRSRNARHKHKLSLLEGAELINVAMKAGLSIKHVYFSHPSILDDLQTNSLSNGKVTFHHVRGEHIKRVSKIGITSSIFGICSIPDEDNHIGISDGTVVRRPISLICDNIRDPANMAVLITTAVATSCDQLLITKGCVDVWDPKVLKSAGVALFRIAHRTDLDWMSIETALPVAGCRVLLADSGLGGSRKSESPSVPCDYDSLTYKSRDRIALVIGGETHGVSRSAYEFCSSRRGNIVRIPMLTGVDSLNASVSASIILYEIRRQIALESNSISEIAGYK